MGLFLYNRCILTQRVYIEIFRGSKMVSDNQSIADEINYEFQKFFNLYVVGGTVSVIETNVSQKEVNSGIILKGYHPFYRNKITNNIDSYWSCKIEKEVYRLDHLNYIRNCRKLEEVLEEEHEP